MEHEHHSVNYFALMHGLYLGLALILNSVIFFLMGSPFSQASGYISYAIIIAGISWSNFIYRGNSLKERVTYGRVLILGTLQSLFASLIIASFTFILFKIVDKSLIDKLLASTEEQLLRNGMSEIQVDAMMAGVRKIFIPHLISFSQILGITFMGFLFSSLLAVFFQKKSTSLIYGVE